jgi:hypothetical protein
MKRLAACRVNTSSSPLHLVVIFTMKCSASILIRTSFLLLLSSAALCLAYPEPRDPSKIRPFASLKRHDKKPPRLSTFGRSDHRVSTWDVVPRGGGGGLGVVKDWIPSKGATARFANVVFWIIGLTSAADAGRGWEHTGLKVARGSLAEWLSERHGYVCFRRHRYYNPAVATLDKSRSLRVCLPT